MKKIILIFLLIVFSVSACYEEDFKELGQAPVLLSPDVSYALASTTPTFIWSSVVNAKRYDVVIDDNTVFTGDATSYVPYYPFLTGIHSIRIIAKNDIQQRSSTNYLFQISKPDPIKIFLPVDNSYQKSGSLLFVSSHKYKSIKQGFSEMPGISMTGMSDPRLNRLIN